VRNILYFLLGFIFVTGLLLRTAFAGYPGECTQIFSTKTFAETTSAYATQTTDSVTTDSVGQIYAVNTLKPAPVTYAKYTVVNVYYEGGAWNNAGSLLNVKFTGAPLGIELSAANWSAAGMLAAKPACTPPPCDPPKALNGAGVCVTCPSGLFSVGDDVCIPQCDYSRAYIPGNLYNPPGGSFCVQPPCGSGQIANDEGRCVPNCPENQKVDFASGSCVLDCIFGTHADGGVCVNDCPEGQMRDAETGSCINQYDCYSGEELCHSACVPKCLPGETRDPRNCQCMPSVGDCPFGQHMEGGKCVATTVNCPPGTAFDASAHTCKPVAATVTAVKSPTVTDPDGTTHTTTTNTVSTGGDSPTEGTTTTTTTTNTDGSVEESTSYTPSVGNPSKYESPPHTLDWSAWNSQVKRAAETGPVKLLQHVSEIVAWFDVVPEAPSFTGVIGGHSFNVNLSAFDGVAEVTRFFLSCLMTVGVFWFGYRLFGLI